MSLLNKIKRNVKTSPVPPDKVAVKGRFTFCSYAISNEFYVIDNNYANFPNTAMTWYRVSAFHLKNPFSKKMVI